MGRFAPSPSELPGDAEPTAIWTVTRLTSELRNILRGAFSGVWVEGEVSNLSRSGAGHAYLTIKDDNAQLRAVLWRNDLARVPFDVRDGMQVHALGSIDVYAARGQYQLTIRRLVPKGVGPLELAFRQLREKLAGEGLFDAALKRPIPAFPRRVAVVTSPRGAAIRDFLEVARRRWQDAEIVVIPATVQGERAVPELLAGIEVAQTIGVDVLALVRGGGSLEDLWAFNDESLARAIRAAAVPIVAGVGHEVDVTIADLVADMRALTPSEAAERIFPDGSALDATLRRLAERLAAGIRTSAERANRRLEAIERAHPLRMPLDALGEFTRRLDDAERSLCASMRRRLDDLEQLVVLRAGALEALSPLAVLRRGFCLTNVLPEGRLVHGVADLKPNDAIRLRLADGHADCTVQRVQHSDA